MSEPLVLSAQAGAVRRLTLNRPKALNSFASEMHTELAAALADVEADTSVRCLVLTGVGRGFCAGLRALPVPVIAAVNGVAAGAGASIALG